MSLAWRIELTSTAVRDLKKLDKQTSRRIVDFLQERLALLDDPRTLGKALQGIKYQSMWRYRVGDYRILATIDDGLIVIEVVTIGHRREVYKH